jgi:hypothetical protein
MAVIAGLAIIFLRKERHASSHYVAGCTALGGADPQVFAEHQNEGGMPW